MDIIAEAGAYMPMDSRRALTAGGARASAPALRYVEETLDILDGCGDQGPDSTASAE